MSSLSARSLGSAAFRSASTALWRLTFALEPTVQPFHRRIRLGEHGVDRPGRVENALRNDHLDLGVSVAVGPPDALDLGALLIAVGAVADPVQRVFKSVWNSLDARFMAVYAARSSSKLRRVSAARFFSRFCRPVMNWPRIGALSVPKTPTTAVTMAAIAAVMWQPYRDQPAYAGRVTSLAQQPKRQLRAAGRAVPHRLRVAVEAAHQAR